MSGLWFNVLVAALGLALHAAAVTACEMRESMRKGAPGADASFVVPDNATIALIAPNEPLLSR